MCLFSSGPSAPAPPAPPPKQPTYASDSVQGARKAEMKRQLAQSKAGSAGTILTNQSGLVDEEVATRGGTLLGGNN